MTLIETGKKNGRARELQCPDCGWSCFTTSKTRPHQCHATPVNLPLATVVVQETDIRKTANGHTFFKRQVRIEIDRNGVISRDAQAWEQIR